MYLRVVFLKLGEIDTLKENFAADAFIQARWKEPRLDNTTDAVCIFPDMLKTLLFRKRLVWFLFHTLTYICIEVFANDGRFIYLIMVY